MQNLFSKVPENFCEKSGVLQRQQTREFAESYALIEMLQRSVSRNYSFKQVMLYFYPYVVSLAIATFSLRLTFNDL